MQKSKAHTIFICGNGKPKEEKKKSWHRRWYQTLSLITNKLMNTTLKAPHCAKLLMMLDQLGYFSRRYLFIVGYLFILFHYQINLSF